MSNPNFVSDLVAMAKAFEELPDVKAALEAKTHDFDVAQQMIQRLELRIMDLKNEVDTAHAATRKVEVERDHAERMFLETDDRLNAFRRLLAGFQTEANALVKAEEPEPMPEPEPVKVGASEVSPSADALHEPALQSERVTEALTVGAESAADPTTAPTPNSSPSTTPEVATEASSVASVESTSTDGVSVQPDPTLVMESSSENVSSGSGSQGLREVDPIAATATTGYAAAASEQPAPSTTDASLHSEVAAPADPTASSVAGDGHSSDDATQASTAPSAADATTQASPTDDVGYHNEPKIGNGDGAWQAWDDWCHRMNQKFGPGGWPPRNVPSVA